MSRALCRTRPVSQTDTALIDLIAQRMRATLVEVEGEQAGTAMYTLDWLRDRVCWHLDPGASTAQVMVAEDVHGDVLGHTIYRLEKPADGAAFGLVSTTYVMPHARRHGVAALLLSCAEAWFQEKGLSRAATWTSATNTPLLQLYERHGYVVVERAPNELTGTAMVRLERRFS